MSTSVPGNSGGADDGQPPSATLSNRPDGRRGDALRSADAPPHGSERDADMEAIAAQLSRLTDLRDRPSPSGPAPGRSPVFDVQTAIRDAVAEISRRQAALDEHADSPPSTAPASDEMPASSRAAPRPAAPRADPVPPRARSGPPRTVDLSSEVDQTFARFSREMRDAIKAVDARPHVDALGHQVRQIGRAIDGMGAALPAEAVAEIGAQTREMRDLLKAATDRAPAGLSGDRPSPVPGFADTMAEVRALFEAYQPGAALASLESRLDALTTRIERGLGTPDPSGLIEGLGRRVDEIHASLRSQMAESAVDTRPLEGLVRSLSDRIGQAREASSDHHQLETTLRDVAARIEGAATGTDPRGAKALETHFSRLTERLDRSEAGLKSLEGVEHAMGELFSQFEVTRQVAIDAAETAARTAARDTLRAALQNPGLVGRAGEPTSELSDRLARGIDELRTLQDQADRRTQASLLDLRATMDRLSHRVTGDAEVSPEASEARRADEPRRRGTAARDPSYLSVDPSELLIEPGLGRAQGGRADARRPAEAEEGAPPDAAIPEPEGSAAFIAAARRAAQASAASAAALKVRERRPAAKGRPPSGPLASSGSGKAGGVRRFLAKRRRPLLLGLAALVLLVGTLEIVRMGLLPNEAPRATLAEAPAPPRAGTADLATPPVASAPAAVSPAAPAPPPLPTFLAGPPKPAAAASDGPGEGLQRSAAAGDPAAQFELGLRYADGRGVARDPKQAVAWFEKAAAKGSAPAEYRLGSAYEKGVGVDRDPSLAMAWYGKAAEAGNIRAMHNLAVMAAEGAAGKPDYARAAQWFGKASTFGVRDSQFNLAILYARGLGIEQSLAQSYTWFAIAAAEGDDDAAKKRDEVAGRLDPKALDAAKAAAEAYRAAAPASSANDVTPPPGGWEAASSRPPVPPPASGAKVSQL